MVKAVEVDGRSPGSVVLELLRVAVAAGEGVIADLPGVLAERAHLAEVLQRVPENQRDPARAAVPARATLLDPRRPARDLLEHLLDGIASCHLIFAEYADDLDNDDLSITRTGFEDTGDGGDAMSDVDEDVNGDGERGELPSSPIRDQADATRTRLTQPARPPGPCSGFRLGMSHRRA